MDQLQPRLSDGRSREIPAAFFWATRRSIGTCRGCRVLLRTPRASWQAICAGVAYWRGPFPYWRGPFGRLQGTFMPVRT